MENNLVCEIITTPKDDSYLSSLQHFQKLEQISNTSIKPLFKATIEYKVRSKYFKRKYFVTSIYTNFDGCFVLPRSPHGRNVIVVRKRTAVTDTRRTIGEKTYYPMTLISYTFCLSRLPKKSNEISCEKLFCLCNTST